MTAKDETLANITTAQTAARELPRSRSASMVATKLDEAELWMRTLAGPEPLCFTKSGDVLTASPRHATIRIELVDEGFADCKLTVEGSTPIVFSVHKPHDRVLVEEATEVAAAVYWSRARSLDGLPPGAVSVTS